MQLIFILWLDSKGLLGEWIEEVVRCESDLCKLMGYQNPEKYIIAPFRWYKSKRGFNFWQIINKEWINLAREIEILNTI